MKSEIRILFALRAVIANIIISASFRASQCVYVFRRLVVCLPPHTRHTVQACCVHQQLTEPHTYTCSYLMVVQTKHEPLITNTRFANILCFFVFISIHPFVVIVNIYSPLLIMTDG